MIIMLCKSNSSKTLDGEVFQFRFLFTFRNNIQLLGIPLNSQCPMFSSRYEAMNVSFTLTKQRDIG